MSVIEYEIPSSWIWTRIGDVSHVEKEHIEPKENPNIEFNYLSIENVESGTGNLVKFKPTKGKEIGSSKLKFTTKDILYSKLRPYLNKVHVPTFSGVSATDLIPIRPEIGISREYLAYYLRLQRIVEYLNSRVHGIQLPRVSVDDILETPIPLIPVGEQKRIVLKIEELFKESKSVRETLDKIPQIMKKFRQSILAAAFRGELVPQNPDDEHAEKLLEKIKNERRKKWEEDIRSKGQNSTKFKYDEPETVETDGLIELPKGWVWTIITHICFTSSGGTPLRSKKEYYGNGIPWVKSGELKDTIIENSEETITKKGLENSSAKIFPKGTVLVAMYGANVGKTGVLGMDASTNQAVCAVFNNKAILDTDYLFFYLRSKKEDLIKKSFGGAQPNISQEIIKKLEIPLPPINEQKRIVSKIKELFSFADCIENSVKETKKRTDVIDQAILAKAFQGELVLQDSSDESASLLLEKLQSQRLNKSKTMTNVKSK